MCGERCVRVVCLHVECMCVCVCLYVCVLSLGAVAKEEGAVTSKPLQRPKTSFCPDITNRAAMTLSDLMTLMQKQHWLQIWSSE